MNEPPRILTESISLSDDVDPQEWSFHIAYEDKVVIRFSYSLLGYWSVAFLLHDLSHSRSFSRPN